MGILYYLIRFQPFHPDANDEKFLNTLQLRSWDFFDQERNPEFGWVPDRAKADGSKGGPMSSVAAVGFELTAISIADSRGWIPRDESLRRVRQLMQLFDEKLLQHNGFYYHFYEMHNAKRCYNSELSSIDTALLLAGALTAREYFQDPEITERVNRIYDRVDWQWMLNDTDVLSIGWRPENGFIPYYWDNYSEHMLMYLIGMGSRTHPLTAKNWQAWRREPVSTWYGTTFLEARPLFIHQYSQAFVDFRNKSDGRFDYHTNSVLATLAQRRMCMELSSKFPSWGKNMWGITASDSPNGYLAWGGPAPDDSLDGTLVPCAPGGSIPFAPRECIDALRYMKINYGHRIWRKYGFVDAFNVEKNWQSDYVIGIDVGITLIQAENYRSGFVWKYFMQASEIQQAMQKAGFKPGGAPNPKSSLMNGKTREDL